MKTEDNNQIKSGYSPTSGMNAEAFAKLQNDVKRHDDDLKETKEKFEKSRFDLITLLGLFVGLITFLGLEIQVFKTIDNPILIIGISMFFIASILLFILTMDLVLKRSSSVNWEDFRHPLYVILCILLVISIAFIIWGKFTTSKDRDADSKSSFICQNNSEIKK